MPARDEVRVAISARLSRPAVEHSLRVAETAVRLADTYGVNADEAWVAGALHDWCRECGTEELLAKAASSGRAFNDAELSVPYLLHAGVGAAEVASMFPGLPPRVLSAIASHTYGAPEMDDLGMVVYIADAIEPSREWSGVSELRAISGEVSLDELFARTYVLSMKHLVKARRPIHPASVETWNKYVAGAVR